MAGREPKRGAAYTKAKFDFVTATLAKSRGATE
jgi:hypothetical protein